MTTTLVLSTWSLPAARALGDAARRKNWTVALMGETPGASSEVVYYGGADRALEAAAQFNLVLLEPSLDLLARLPVEFLRRAVEFARFGDLG